MTGSEFEPTEEDEMRGFQDSERLIKIVTDRTPGSSVLDKIAYPIADVVVNLERLGSYLELSSSLAMPVYGMKTSAGTIVCDPVAGLMSTTATFNTFGVQDLANPFRAMDRIFRWFGQMRLMFKDEAIESTRTSLRSYLTTRIAGLRPGTDDNPFQQDVPPTTYLVDFEVRTMNRGLNIEVSPAYFACFRYFGSPTSPVAGKVEAGNVFFRATGPIVFGNDETVVPVPRVTSFQSSVF